MSYYLFLNFVLNKLEREDFQLRYFTGEFTSKALGLYCEILCCFFVVVVVVVFFWGEGVFVCMYEFVQVMVCILCWEACQLINCFWNI